MGSSLVGPEPSCGMAPSSLLSAERGQDVVIRGESANIRPKGRTVGRSDEIRPLVSITSWSVRHGGARRGSIELAGGGRGSAEPSEAPSKKNMRGMVRSRLT